MIGKEDKDNKVVELIENKKSLQNLNESLQTELWQMEQQFENLGKSSEILQNENKEIKREKEYFTIENSKLVNDMKEITKVQLGLEECIQNYKLQIISTNEELNSLKKEFESSKKIDSNIIEVEKTKLEEDLRCKEIENQTKIIYLEEQINELTNKNAELNYKAIEILKMIEEEREINKEKETKIVNLRGQVESGENKIQKLNSDLIEDKNLIETSKQEALDFVNQISVLTIKSEQDEKEIRDSNENTKVLEMEIKALEGRLNDANEKNLNMSREVDSCQDKIHLVDKYVVEDENHKKIVMELEALNVANVEEKSRISKKLLEVENELVKRKKEIKEKYKISQEKDNEIKMAKVSSEQIHCELEVMITRNKVFEEEIDSLRKANDQNKAVIQAIVTEFENNHHKVSLKVNEIETVSQQLQQEKVELLAKIDEISNDLCVSHKSMTDNEVKLKSIIQTLERDQSEMKAMNTALRNELATTTTKMATDSSEKEKLMQSQLTETEKILEDLKIEMDNNKKVTKDNENVLKQLNEELNLVKCDREEATASLKEKETIINELEGGIRNMKLNLDTLTGKNTEQVKLIDLLKTKIKEQSEMFKQEKQKFDEEITKSKNNFEVEYERMVEEARTSKQILEEKSKLTAENKLEVEAKVKIIEEHKVIMKEKLNEIDRLRAVLEELHGVIGVYQLQPISAMEHLHQEILFIKNINAGLIKKNEQNNINITNLKETLQKERMKMHEIESFNQSNLICNQYIDSFEANNALIIDLKSQIVLLKEDLFRFKSLYERLAQEKTKMDLESKEELIKVKCTLRETEIKNNELQQHNGNNYFDSIEELNEEVMFLKKCLEETNEMHRSEMSLLAEKYEDIKQSRENLGNEIARIKEREEAKNHEMFEKDSMMRQIKMEYDESLKAINEKKNSIEEFNNKSISVASKEKQDLEDELLKQKDNFSKNETDLSELKRHVVETQKHNSDQFEILNNQIKVKDDALMNAVRNSQQLNKDLEILKVDINTKKEEAEKLNRIIEELNIKLKYSNDQLFMKSTEIEDLKLNLNGRINDISLKEGTNISELNKKIEKLLSQIHSSNLLNESLVNENRQLTKTISSTQEELNLAEITMQQPSINDHANLKCLKEKNYENDIVNFTDYKIDKRFFENNNVTENKVEFKLKSSIKCFVYNSLPLELISGTVLDSKPKSNKVMKLEQAKLLKNKKLQEKEIELLKIQIKNVEITCAEKVTEVSHLKSKVDQDNQHKMSADEYLKEIELLKKALKHYKNKHTTNTNDQDVFNDLIDDKFIENNHFGREYNPSTPPTSPSLTSASSRAVSEVRSTQADDTVDLVDNVIFQKNDDKRFVNATIRTEQSSIGFQIGMPMEDKNDSSIKVRTVGEQVDFNDETPKDLNADQLIIVQQQFQDVVRLNTQLKDENNLLHEDLNNLSQTFDQTKKMCYELDQKLEEIEERLKKEVEDGKSKDAEIEELKANAGSKQNSDTIKEDRVNQCGEIDVLSNENKMLNNAVKKYSSKITELQDVVDVQNLYNENSKARENLFFENTHLHEENLKLMDENDQIKNKIEQLQFELNRANNTLGLHLDSSHIFKDNKTDNSVSEKLVKKTDNLLITSTNSPNTIKSEHQSFPINNNILNSTMESSTQINPFEFVFSPELNSPSSFSGSENFLLSDDGHLSSSEHEDIFGKLHLVQMENESLKKALKEMADMHTCKDIKKSIQHLSSDSDLNQLGGSCTHIDQMANSEKVDSNFSPPTTNSQTRSNSNEQEQLKLNLVHVQDFSMSGSETNYRLSVRSSSSSSNSINADRFLVRTPRLITSTSNDYQLELSEAIGKTIDDYIGLQGDYKRFKLKARNEYSRIKTRLVDALKQYNLLKIKYQELHDSVIFNNFVDQNLMVTENNALRSRVLELEIVVGRRDRMLKAGKNYNENGERNIKFDQPVIYEEKEEEMEENNKMLIEKLRDLEFKLSMMQSECNVLTDRNQKLNKELRSNYHKDKSQCLEENIEKRVLVKEEPVIKIECFTLEDYSVRENQIAVSTETTPTSSCPPFNSLKSILMVDKSVQMDNENILENVKTFSDASTEAKIDRRSASTLTNENTNDNYGPTKKSTQQINSVSSLSNNQRKFSTPCLSSSSSSSSLRRPTCSSSSKHRSASSSSLTPSKSSKNTSSVSKCCLKDTNKLTSMSTTEINIAGNTTTKINVSKLFCKYCKEKALECSRLQRLIWGAEEKLSKYQKDLDDMVVENENLSIQDSGLATSQLTTTLTASTSRAALSSAKKNRAKLSTLSTTSPMPPPVGKFVRKCLKFEIEKLEKEERSQKSNKAKVATPIPAKSSLSDATRNLVENVEAIVKKNEKLMEYNKERMKILKKDYASAGAEIKSMKVSTLAKMQPSSSLSSYQSSSTTPLSSDFSSPVSYQGLDDSVILQKMWFNSSTIVTTEILQTSYERVKTDYERLNKLYLETFKEKQALLADITKYKERDEVRSERMKEYVEVFKTSQNKINIFDHEKDLIKQKLESIGFDYNSLFIKTDLIVDKLSFTPSSTLPSSSYSTSKPLSSCLPFTPSSSLSSQVTTFIQDQSVGPPEGISCPIALDMMQYYVDTLQHQFVTSSPVDLIYSLLCQVDQLNNQLAMCHCRS